MCSGASSTRTLLLAEYPLNTSHKGRGHLLRTFRHQLSARGPPRRNASTGVLEIALIISKRTTFPAGKRHGDLGVAFG